MSVLDRLLGKGRELRAARRAELRGDLAKAVELYGLASAPQEAARVMLLRGDAETDTRVRLAHFTQAVAIAPAGHAVRVEARRKRATLVIAQLGSGPVSQASKQDVIAAARELLDVGDAQAAAEVFRLAGDIEGEASALQLAGNVESLEALLTERQTRDRVERERTKVHQDVEMLLSAGRRREGLDLAARWLVSHDDPPLRDHIRSVEGRRALGPIIHIAVRATPLVVVLGDQVVVGRTEGALRVASAAVSHAHVRIARDGVRDLETRNGTQLRGIDLRGVMQVPPDGMDLTLGRQVRLRVAPAPELAGAVRIEVGGESYVAPLDVLHVPELPWVLVPGPEGWVELVTNGRPAYLGDVELSDRVTLLVGDVLTSERGGPEVVRVVGSLQ